MENFQSNLLADMDVAMFDEIGNGFVVVFTSTIDNQLDILIHFAP